MSDTEVGTPFHERFAIRERLGAGGMGVVYAAYDRERDETVALKTLHNRDASALYAFKKEFRTLAGVAHPNLVSLYELIADGEQWFFTMELIDGENFVEYVRPAADTTQRVDSGSELTATLPLDQTLPAPSDQPIHPRRPLEAAFDEARLRAAARQLAVGVRALHNAGKVHRDLKPHNVLVTGDGRVVILDFGVARELAPTLSQLTVEAGLPGTLAYMAPEQARGKDATPASDWYAVGVMLFEALTGHLPFTGTISRVLTDKLHKTAPSPRQLVSDPPADLLELVEDLLARDADSRPSATGVLARLGGAEPIMPDQSYLRIESAGDRLASRRSHLEILETAFGRTLSGEPTSVHVHGTSGMGKTAIVHFFLKGLIEQKRAVVLPGRCYAQELVPYKGLDGVVDSLSKYLLSLPRQEAEILLPREIQDLARLFPVLSRVDAIAAASRTGRGAADRLTRRRLAFGALRELLVRIAEQQPVVIYIDDLQWADADSAALLGDLLRPPAAPPLLLITSFRSEEIASQSFLADLVSLAGHAEDPSHSLELPVEPLADGDATRLANALLGDPPGLQALVKTIVREARGNPFLIEQLVGYALADGPNLAVTGLDSRITLADMLATRIRQLPPGAEALLLILAAAGRPLDAAVAYRAAGLEGDERPLIATLQAAHLVRSSGSARTVELYHDRIREALASRVDPARARSLHRTLAATLVERGLDDPEALFTHYRSAGENALAGEQAALAAGKASDALAFDRAALFYLRALDLGSFDRAEEETLRLGLAESLANAGRPADAAKAFLELAHRVAGDQSELPLKGGGSVHALGYRSRAARMYLEGGYFDQGFAELRSVLAEVGLKMPESAWGAILSLLWQRLLLRLRGLGFRSRDAERIAQEELLRIDACNAAASGLATADTVRGADFHSRQLRFALRAGEPMRVARALGLEVFYLATAGTAAGKRATQVLDQTFELARSAGDPFIIGLTHLHAGVQALFRGDWGVAIEHSDEAEAIFAERCTGTMMETTYARRCSLAARLQRGELAEIARILPDLLAEADELGNVLAAANLRARFGIIRLAADDPQGCRRTTDRGLAAWSRQGFQLAHCHGLISHCLADLYEGRGESSLQRLLEGWPRGPGSLVTRVQVVRIEIYFLRGRCALAAAGDREGRLRVADRAARRLAGEKAAYALPMVEQIRAALAHLAGDGRAAQLALRRAAGGFSNADMHLFAAANRWRWGQLAGDDQGRARLASAEAWMRDQGIQRPERMVAALVPGFDDA